jgi:hypothetical protein
MKFNAGDRFRTVSGAWERGVSFLGTRDREDFGNED